MTHAEHGRNEIPSELVSVIIPAFNEERWIGQTVASVLAQRLSGHRLEVLVADTGSTDCTGEIARSLHVTLLDISKPSSYVARNRGIEASTGSILVFLDADCIPQPGWLQELLDCARRENLSYVAGRIENAVQVDNLANRLLAFRTSPEVRRRNVQSGGVAAGNMLVRREVFDQLGLFPPVRSGGDIHQSKRALIAGFSVGYAERAVVMHQCDLSNWDYLRRRFRIRRGQARLERASGAFWRCIQGLPWRPGYRESERVAQAIVSPRPAVLIFLWLERWAEYFGALAGHGSAVVMGSGRDKTGADLVR